MGADPRELPSSQAIARAVATEVAKAGVAERGPLLPALAPGSPLAKSLDSAAADAVRPLLDAVEAIADRLAKLEGAGRGAP